MQEYRSRPAGEAVKLKKGGFEKASPLIQKKKPGI